MNRKNLLSGRDKQMQDMADTYENALTEGTSFYLDADDWADLADWYAVRGKMKQALAIAKDGLKAHPDSTPLLVEQAYLFIDTDKGEKAWLSLNRIREGYLPEVKILKAHLLMLDGQTEEAEELLDSLDDKEDLANIIEVVYLYLDFNLLDKACQWLMNGKEDYEDNESYMAVTADYYCATGDYPQAADYYNKLLDRNPYSSLYWYGLARCHYEMEELNKCIDACDYSLLSDEEFGDAYVLRGHAYFRLSNDEKAAEDYRMGIKYNSLSLHYLNAIEAFRNIGKGNWKEGLRYIKLAIAHPDECAVPLSTLYANAAFCHAKLNRRDKAESYCLMALEEDPDDTDALLLLNRIYLQTGNPGAASELWDRMKSLVNDAETWFDIGNLCIETNQLQLARNAFEEVYLLNPDHPQIHRILALLYLTAKDIKQFRFHNEKTERPIPPDVAESMMKKLNGNYADYYWKKVMKAFYDQ